MFVDSNFGNISGESEMQCLEDDAGLSSSLGAMNLKCLEDDAGLSSSLRQGR